MALTSATTSGLSITFMSKSGSWLLSLALNISMWF